MKFPEDAKCDNCAVSAELEPKKDDLMICMLRLVNVPRNSLCGEYEKKTKRPKI